MASLGDLQMYDIDAKTMIQCAFACAAGDSDAAVMLECGKALSLIERDTTRVALADALDALDEAQTDFEAAMAVIEHEADAIADEDEGDDTDEDDALDDAIDMARSLAIMAFDAGYAQAYEDDHAAE